MTKREMSFKPEHRPEFKEALDKMLLHIPGVKGSKAFGYPAYKINGRVFAFVGDNGISLKLPAERVRELVEGDENLHPFEVAGRVTWKEWVFVQLDDPDAYTNYSTLFDDAIQFVAGTM